MTGQCTQYKRRPLCCRLWLFVSPPTERSAVMSQEKYIGMDVHQATISVAVLDSRGKLIMGSILETKAATILEFLQGLHGSLSVTFEEGTSAAWLHDLVKPHVTRLVVCDPRKNALLKDGSKSDRIDARKLAELLRGNQLTSVYHGEHGMRTLKELGRSYQTITKDLTRVMSGIKPLYRTWAIACSGTSVYAPRHCAEWLGKIPEPGVRLRAERLYQQLDLLQPVRQQARRDLLTESRKHHAVKLLRQIPSIGPIRAALLVAQLQTPHRFRTKRQLWAYSGFALETHDSGEYRYVRGKLQRNRERMTVRGLSNNHNPEVKNLFKGAAISASTPHRFRTKRQLWAYSGFALETHDSGEYRYVRGKLQRNRERMTVRGLSNNHNPEVKNLFKGAAISASTHPGPLYDFYVALLKKGMRPTMARLTLARKIASITLTIWKKGADFDATQLHRQEA